MGNAYVPPREKEVAYVIRVYATVRYRIRFIETVMDIRLLCVDSARVMIVYRPVAVSDLVRKSLSDKMSVAVST